MRPVLLHPLPRRRATSPRGLRTGRSLRAAAPGLLLGAIVGMLLAGCGPGIPQRLPEQKPLSSNEIETYARRHLHTARALRDEGRLEAAARVAARGLELRPDDADLQRLRAEVLEGLGRVDEARAHLRVADALSPPPPPLPAEPLEVPSDDVVVTLLPPPADRELADRVPRDWPAGPVATALGDRIRTRLPRATLLHDDPDTVAEARAPLSEARVALSVRVDRAFCGESLKDGRFAVAWLRVAAAGPGREATRRQIRRSVSPPSSQASCREEVVARALEAALTSPDVAAALHRPREPEAGRPGAGEGGPSWGSPALRALYPGIGRHLAREIEAGRARLAVGDLEAAAEHFRAAAAIDPQDLDARAFLEDLERSLELSRELAPVSAPSPETLAAVGATREEFDAQPTLVHGAPLLGADERRRMEARLAEEQRMRRELLSALAVLDEDREAPSASTLAALRPAGMPAEETTGVALARARSDGPLESRLSYTPDGTVLARYYFTLDEAAPVLREEDADEDGRPDRWVAYRGGARHEVWEDRTGSGRPDLHLVFAEGGDPLQRLEVDSDGDGRTERVFRYEAGRLVTEDRDTDGDGRPDLFERFDAAGALAQREEDLDGDGEVDVRTKYSSGRLVKREILDPEVVTEIQ